MKNLRYTCFLVFLFFSVISLAQTHTAKRGVVTCPISNGYYEYLPQGYWDNPNEKFPVIIFVPGVGELGNGTTDLDRVLAHGPANQIAAGQFPSSFTVNGQNFKFIVITPQFTQGPWTGHFNTFLDYILSHYKIDINRVYLSGFSLGGGTCWSYVGEKPEYASRIAAVVPIAGAWAPNSAYCQNIASSGLPVLAMHNSVDNTVPTWYTNSWVDGINTAPQPPAIPAKKLIYPLTGHVCVWSFDLNLNSNGQWDFPAKNVYEWMLLYQRNLAILPVTYTRFQVTKQSGKANLLWSTAQETNNRGFTIQRSSDAVNWQNIAYVNSLGNNGGDYSFTDEQPLAGKNYYRLLQNETDNQLRYSDTRMIEFSNKVQLTVYTNPVTDILTIHSNTQLQNARVSIYNMSGQLVKQQVISGSAIIPVSISGLSAGAYIAHIYNEAVNEKLKFVKP